MSNLIYDILYFATLLKDYTEKGFLEHKVVKTKAPVEKQIFKSRKDLVKEDVVENIELSLDKVIIKTATTEKQVAYPSIKVDEKSIEIRKKKLDTLNQEVENCKNCPLHTGRLNTVAGGGVLNPIVLVIGEAPGAEEDQSGQPFVGKAGKYLDSWLSSIGLSRDRNIYISNVIKCRPPQNRTPSFSEIEKCSNFIERQIEILKPLIILSLGNPATMYLSKDHKTGITKKRGIPFLYTKSEKFSKEYQKEIIIIPTYHPSGVIRELEIGIDKKKKEVWQDLKLLEKLLTEYIQ